MGAAKHDLIVVGGGPAGIATALHVAHYAPGLSDRMLVLEKARYPRDKYCAGAIGGRGLLALARIGVEVAVPHVPIHAISIRAAGEDIILRERDLGIVVRRIEFDEALAREATRRGIEVREGAEVEGIEMRADGVTLRLTSGDALDARAVVGADGVAGAVRRAAGLTRASLRAQAVEVDTQLVAGDPLPDTLRFDFGDPALAGYAWDFPTLVDGQAMMCRGVYRLARGHGPAPSAPGAELGPNDDARAHLARFLEGKGLDLGRHRVKQFAEQGFRPADPISVPRLLLVGEAAGIDIATGEGIAQAIQYGALAGRYLARAFSRGNLAFSDWTGTVRRRRLGWQLRQRLWFSERFYGPGRAVMEKLLVAMPSALRLGALQFGGKVFSPASLAGALAEAATATARLGAGDVLRAIR
jgi:flavin-dependent dehydrogenase